LRAAAKMVSVVTLIIEKTMKKIFKKKLIYDLPTLIFLRYETGTTGVFLRLIKGRTLTALNGLKGTFQKKYFPKVTSLFLR
jgi:hypothetical protein